MPDDPARLDRSSPAANALGECRLVSLVGNPGVRLCARERHQGALRGRLGHAVERGVPKGYVYRALDVGRGPRHQLHASIQADRRYHDA